MDLNKNSNHPISPIIEEVKNNDRLEFINENSFIIENRSRNDFVNE
jgi:hypothetical protein